MSAVLRAAGLSLVLAAGVPGWATAQALLPDAPLTTLLRPQPLERSRPLLQAPAAAPRRADPSTSAGTPCERTAGSSSVPAVPRAAYGGSGPGEYARFMPGASASAPAAPRSGGAEPPSKPAAPSAPGVDRPLVSGSERPLWSTGERPAKAKATAARSGSAKPAASDLPKDPAQTETDAPSLPEDARDRPLWAETPDTPLAGPDSPGAVPRYGVASLTPCVAPAR